MISVVCVYNNKKVFNEYIYKSLKKQSGHYEFIPIDNTSNKYKSAAEALNYGAKLATGKYIMFAHQDIDFSSDDWLKNVETILDSLPNLGIAGVCGRIDKNGVMTAIYDGMPPRLAGNIHISKPIPVQTLDECLFIIPKFMFNILKFDEDVCDNWHLYAIDYSLACKTKGFEVYVLPLYLYHLSTYYTNKKWNILEIILRLGDVPEAYYTCLQKLLIKYKSNYTYIYTFITYGDWNTNYPLFYQRIWKLSHYIFALPRQLLNKIIKIKN